jgi:D-proline reductase (dithiol) PrdB
VLAPGAAVRFPGMNDDATIRAGLEDMPAPELDPVATTLDAPLAECRVAIVTTAGLTPNGEVELWMTGDHRYQELAGDARDLQLSHFSPNFDRVGIIQDLNVVYPVDRLGEMAADGEIGSVNQRHFSFMGAQLEYSTMIQDTGPAVAQQLLDDGVDVVLLTPV